MIYEGGEIDYPHLLDVPSPHSGIGVVERCVFGFEATAVVAKPDVVASVIMLGQNIRQVGLMGTHALHK